MPPVVARSAFPFVIRTFAIPPHPLPAEPDFWAYMDKPRGTRDFRPRSFGHLWVEFWSSMGRVLDIYAVSFGHLWRRLLAIYGGPGADPRWKAVGAIV